MKIKTHTTGQVHTAEWHTSAVFFALSDQSRAFFELELELILSPVIQKSCMVLWEQRGGLRVRGTHWPFVVEFLGMWASAGV